MIYQLNPLSVYMIKKRKMSEVGVMAQFDCPLCTSFIDVDCPGDEESQELYTSCVKDGDKNEKFNFIL